MCEVRTIRFTGVSLSERSVVFLGVGKVQSCHLPMQLVLEATSVLNVCCHPFDRNQQHFPHLYLFGSGSSTDALSFSHMPNVHFSNLSTATVSAWIALAHTHLSRHVHGGRRCELSLVSGTRPGSGLGCSDIALSLTGVTGWEVREAFQTLQRDRTRPCASCRALPYRSNVQPCLCLLRRGWKSTNWSWKASELFLTTGISS